MLHINILTPSNYNWFLHQLDYIRYEKEVKFYENSRKDIIWDIVVVYEGIKIPTYIKHKKGGLIFISGEPPYSNKYPNSFLNQFDVLVTSHPKIKHKKNILSQQALNYHFGYDYTTNTFKYNYYDLKYLPLPIKVKNISVITSSKRIMPGHNSRINLINLLNKEFPNNIDFYGKGIAPINDKADAILPYKFHICIENCEIKDYWTEKIADSIIGYSIPIYIGCTNIDQYFNKECMYHLNINDTDLIIKTINKILNNPDEEFNNKIEALSEARNKLLDEYNIFPTLMKIIDSNISLNDETILNTLIKPQKDFIFNRLIIAKLRLARLLNRIVNNIH